MKNKGEREKIADVRLAVSLEEEAIVLIFMILVSPKPCPFSSDAGWPCEKPCSFSQQILEPGFQDQQCKRTQQCLVSHSSLLL